MEGDLGLDHAHQNGVSKKSFMPLTIEKQKRNYGWQQKIKGVLRTRISSSNVKP
jgi:hypothetical protein